MSIKRLKKQVFSSILSNSSIYSQASVLKELVENSIDALIESTNGRICVEIDAKSAGLQYMVVHDNGSGISKDGRSLMCLNCTTSKLRTIDDLNQGITTCGFRGEALYFISQLSKQMQIKTRTAHDDVCEVWNVNKEGLPSAVPEKIAGPIGTTVKLQEIFSSTPVRKQFLQKHFRSQMEKIRRMIIGYSFAYRNIRFQLEVLDVSFNGHLGSVIDNMMIPSKSSSLEIAMNVLKLREKESLFELDESVDIHIPNSDDTFKVHISGVLPRMRAQDEVAASRWLKVLFVNERLLSLKLKFGRTISRGLNDLYEQAMLLKPQAWFLKLDIPPEIVDVNIEPSKDDVMIPAELILLTDVFRCLRRIIRKECTVPEEQPEDLTNFGTSNPSFDADDVGLTVQTIAPVDTTSSDGKADSLFVPNDCDHTTKRVETHVSILHESSDDEASSIILSPQEELTQVRESLTSPPTSQPKPIQISLKRIPLISEMSQRTLGLVQNVLFTPSRNKDHRNDILFRESGWTSRVGIPTQLLQLGFVEILKKNGHRVSLSSLKTELNKDGIFKVEF